MNPPPRNGHALRIAHAVLRALNVFPGKGNLEVATLAVERAIAKIETPRCNQDTVFARWEDSIVVVHPDIPPHVWDGERFVRLAPIDENDAETATPVAIPVCD